MVTPSPSNAEFHIPSLNGIRAFAVGIVFIGHMYGMPSFFPGHVGVTVFFFLSGYLITTLLRREFEKHGTVSLSRFYLRRLLRIQPPALIAILVSIGLGWVGLLAADTSIVGVIAEVFQYTNYYLIATGGREGLPPESSMLWSLAVEEHFYLVFPLVLMLLLLTRRPIRNIGWMLLAIAAVIGLWRSALVFEGGSFFHLYTGTDTRADSILYGSAMAILLNPMYRQVEMVSLRVDSFLCRAAPWAVGLLILSALVPYREFRFTVADVVQAICLVPIFWWVITEPLTLPGQMLNHRWVVRVGILSFSIYLFHRMVIASLISLLDIPSISNLREQLLEPAFTSKVVAANLFAIPITLLVAHVVYRFVEAPCAQLRRRLEVGPPQKRANGVVNREGIRGVPER